jgi:hypothetical protein
MRLVALVARVSALVDSAGLFSPALSERKNKMAKTDHWGALAAAAGTLAAVAMLLLIMVVVEARPAEATFPGKPGKIAFSGYDGQDYEIYTIKAGGGGKVKVTDNSTDDRGGLSYSPSGKKIAYSGKDGANGDNEIYTINPDGGGKVKVTDNTTGDYDPSWGSK